VTIHATKSGGRVGIVGLGGDDGINVPLSTAAMREVDLIGVFRTNNE